MGKDELPLFCRHKVAEIREMIMEEQWRGNLMGGNHLDVTVISMSSCLFQITLDGPGTLVCHKKGGFFTENLVNTLTANRVCV